MPRSRSSTATAPALLERIEERRACADALRGLGEGEGRVLSIEGPAGVGKTALLGSLVVEARGEGCEVASARGSEMEREFAFGVVLQLLGPVVERSDPELFEGAAALARPLFERAAAGVGPPPEFQLLHGLYWLCANIAERRPLVLCVDDAQWADPASLRFLAYLGARAAELPLLIAFASRSGEPVDPGPLEDLAELAIANRLAPAELSEAGVAKLVEAELGGSARPGLAGEIFHRSGGNPLFVDELVRAERETEPDEGAPPQTVVNLVRRRAERLPDSAIAVAKALAILGDSASLAEIEAVAEVGQEAILSALDLLAESDLTDQDESRAFRHPILREALVEAAPDGEVRLWNLRAARAVADRDPTRAATHLAAALGEEPSGEPWAAATLRRAAAAARARGGGAEAISYLCRALAEPLAEDERRELLVELGELEALVRDFAALEHLAAASELASSDPVELARIALVRGDALFHFVALEDCSRVCREAIAGLGDRHRELRLALEATALNADALRGVNRDRPAQLAAEVEAASTPGERAVLVHVTSDLAATGETPASRVVELGHRALAGAVLLDEVGAASPIYIYAGTALAWAGGLRTVVELTTEGLEKGRREGSLVAVSYSAALRGGAALLAGDLALAESDSELVVSGLPAADPMAYAVALAWLIETLVHRDRAEDARRALNASGLTGEPPELGTIDFLLMARAELAVAEGDEPAAIADLEEVGRRATRARYLNPAAMPWRSRLAELLARNGDPPRARELVEEELERARAFDSPRALGLALRARGALDGPGGIADLEEAASLLAEVTPLEHAHAVIALGEALHAAADERARETLYAGLDRAHRAGAHALVERALESLRATGARPRRPRLSGVDSLTPQEARVAGMAAGGRANREIAEALFLTRRTVEMHLSNAYRKLGIGSREELPAALGDRQAT